MGLKLAEALNQRKFLRESIQELHGRIRENVYTREDETPDEDVNDLVEEMSENIQQLHDLIRRVNSANSQTVLATVLGDLTISQAVVERDRLDSQVKNLQMVLNIATNSPRDEYDFMGNGEHQKIKHTRNIDPKTLRTRIKELTSTRQSLDSQLQQVNWTVDV